jgi:CheY-like chemotaxis protein
MPKKFLIIDDEKDMTELTSAVLSLSGYSCEIFNDPVQGLARLGRGGIDGLVVDLMMPQMTGQALIEELRRQPSLAALPVFVLSAKNLTADERKRLLALGVHFIPKPFSTRRLSELVRQHVPS